MIGSECLGNFYTGNHVGCHVHWACMLSYSEKRHVAKWIFYSYSVCVCVVLILGADLYVASCFFIWYYISSQKQTWSEVKQHTESTGVERNRGTELESGFSRCFLSLFDYLMPDLKSACYLCFQLCKNTTNQSTEEMHLPQLFHMDMWCVIWMHNWVISSISSSVYVYRSNLGCACSSSESAQPPATHLHPAAALLQPQRDCAVTNHRSNPIYTDTSTPTTPSHDCPLPADAAVNPAATLYGVEHAQPVSVPLCSAHGCTICPS